MKSAKVFLTIFVIISFLTVFGACGKNQSSKPSPTPEPTATPEPTSTISSLNEDENYIFVAIKNTSWNDPSSVRVIKIKKGKYSDKSEEEIFFIEISATNRMGGNTTSYYKTGLFGFGLEETTSTWIDRAKAVPLNYVPDINAAWKEYCEKQGW